MPKKDFEDCVKSGGKVVRKKLKGGKYINICYDKEGKSHAGDIRVTKKKAEEKVEKAKKEQEPRLATEEQLSQLKDYFNNQRS